MNDLDFSSCATVKKTTKKQKANLFLLTKMPTIFGERTVEYRFSFSASLQGENIYS